MLSRVQRIHCSMGVDILESLPQESRYHGVWDFVGPRFLIHGGSHGKTDGDVLHYYGTDTTWQNVTNPMISAGKSTKSQMSDSPTLFRRPRPSGLFVQAHTGSSHPKSTHFTNTEFESYPPYYTTTYWEICRSTTSWLLEKRQP